MNSKQTQKAGDGAIQYQADTIIVQNGVDEKRAREICNEMFDVMRKDLSQEAYDVACRRVTEFENDLIPKMQKIDGALDAFSDPAFQFMITNAHKTAAATDRPADYALLSELLIHRIQRGENRNTVVGISRAVEIVDKISDDALLALSVIFAIEQYVPVTGYISQGLDVLDTFFGKLCYDTLPSGNLWLDHLDILDAIRITHLGTLKKLEEFYSKKMSGYCAAGIHKSSENYKKAQQLLTEAQIPATILIDNELDNDYVRLAVVAESEIDTITLSRSAEINGENIQLNVPLTPEQKLKLHEIYALYDNNSATLEKIKRKFNQELQKRENLRKIQLWWNNIPNSFSITAVGRVLAHTNAKRCDHTLPDLD